MTQFIKQNRAPLFLSGFFCGLAVFTLLAFRTLGREDSSAPPREITLVARDSVFNESNPDLVLRRGKPIRLIVRNEEPGRTLHCFQIPSLGVYTTRNLAAGEAEVITFTPRKKGVFGYACLMHPSMNGRVIVE